MDININLERSYPTPFANATLLPLLLMSLTRQKHTPDTSKIIKTEYDYVIVGGGSAGSVVAGRLTEIPCVSALLLEAGGPPPLLTDVPSLARFYWFTDIDWALRTVPQRYTGEALQNRQVIWPSGKVLGGSSILNGNLFVRGSRKVYDKWEAHGAKGWSYKDVLPYFKKLEDNRDPEYVANGYHGTKGPVTMHRPRYQPEYKHPLLSTVKSMGYQIVDSNGYRQTGFYDLQGTLRAGQRCSAAKAYLVPAENRTNLDILPRAYVRKVIIKNHRAVGVQFDFQGTTYIVKARKEVIMAAGTVNTAQLLMLSGIGPKKELERFKIPVIADLPVGKNFQDQCGTFLHFLLRPDIQRVTEKLTNPANINQYIQNRTGPLASTEFISIISFLKNGVIVPKKDFPDHQLYFNEAQTEILAQVGLRPEVLAQYYGPDEGKSFYLCVSSIMHPRSRGTVTLQSSDPYDPPLIDPNYFEDPRDIEDVVEGLKVCNRIGNHPIMRKVGSIPPQRIFPGCEKHAGNEDSYFRCLARKMVVTFSHQVGTATMGDPKDPKTVVDPYLRVLKIKGLRVVDASVMPIVPTGNTNVPVMMVAEKASDIIKSTIKCHGHHDSWEEPGSDWKEESSWEDETHYPKQPDSEYHDGGPHYPKQPDSEYHDGGPHYPKQPDSEYHDDEPHYPKKPDSEYHDDGPHYPKKPDLEYHDDRPHFPKKPDLEYHDDRPHFPKKPDSEYLDDRPHFPKKPDLEYQDDGPHYPKKPDSEFHDSDHEWKGKPDDDAWLDPQHDHAHSNIDTHNSHLKTKKHHSWSELHDKLVNDPPQHLPWNHHNQYHPTKGHIHVTPWNLELLISNQQNVLNQLMSANNQSSSASQASTNSSQTQQTENNQPQINQLGTRLQQILELLLGSRPTNMPTNPVQPNPPMNSMQPNAPTNSMQPNPPMNSMQPNPPMNSMQPNPPMNSMQPNPPMNSMQPNPPMSTMQPNTPVNPLNPPMNARPPINMDVLEQLKKLKQTSSCDEDFCKSLLNFMECRQPSCRRQSEFVGYMYNILCSSLGQS